MSVQSLLMISAFIFNQAMTPDTRETPAQPGQGLMCQGSP